MVLVGCLARMKLPHSFSPAGGSSLSTSEGGGFSRIISSLEGENTRVDTVVWT